MCDCVLWFNMQIEHVHDGKFSSTRDKEQTARIF